MSAPTKQAQASLDPVCGAAVELARAAAIEEAEDASLVGEHLGVTAIDERVADHRFAYAGKAYRGWEWSVEVTRVPRAKTATVNEAVLLPGETALLAPEHVPYADRIQPGDLGPGDVHPTPEGDPRLVLRIQESNPLAEPLEDRDILHEQGIGRSRALSVEGRLDAAERWYSGDRGPKTPIAEQAPATCQSCAFQVKLVGQLGAVFGVCTNAISSEDGKVVSYDHGCGGHSEVVVTPTNLWDSPVETPEYEAVDLATVEDAPVVDETVDAGAEEAAAAETAEVLAEETSTVELITDEVGVTAGVEGEPVSVEAAVELESTDEPAAEAEAPTDSE